MRSTTVAVTMAIALTGTIHLASAQDRSAPPMLPPSSNADCQNRAGGVPPVAPGETTGSTLSDQLSRSNGVICPPAGIDPGISAPPTGRGVMPVIPPPGSPGGDPSVVPK
jgi:hypothetical protein